MEAKFMIFYAKRIFLHRKISPTVSRFWIRNDVLDSDKLPTPLGTKSQNKEKRRLSYGVIVFAPVCGSLNE